MKLKPEDVERIHYAGEVLLTRLENPPSLMELARIVGINDHKLKTGFRQVFDTTVFGYLHERRMERSRQLLDAGELTVTEAARAVGFANRGYFAASFRRKFGVNPSAYLHYRRKTPSSDRGFEAGADGLPIEDYITFDLISQLQIGDGTLSLGIENLLDNQYFPVFSQVLSGSDDTNYLAARGRRVSLTYSIALALGIQPVGSTAWLDIGGQTMLDLIKPYLDDHAQELTILGYGEANLKKVLLVKPDLILANNNYEAIYEQLSRIAPTIFYEYSGNSVRWKDITRFVANVLGKSQEAEKLLNDYYQRVQELRQKMGVGVASPEENRASNIQVSVISPEPNGVRLMYKGSLGGSVLEDVGLSRPPEQDKEGTNAFVSFESIPQEE
jgi:AraC-like DNA-binding protein